VLQNGAADLSSLYPDICYTVDYDSPVLYFCGEKGISAMSVTILAVGFMILMLVITFFGYKFIIQQGTGGDSTENERCSLCQEYFQKSTLIERPIGDSRIYRFCDACIKRLYDDLVSKN